MKLQSTIVTSSDFQYQASCWENQRALDLLEPTASLIWCRFYMMTVIHKHRQGIAAQPCLRFFPMATCRVGIDLWRFCVWKTRAEKSELKNLRCHHHVKSLGQVGTHGRGQREKHYCTWSVSCISSSPWAEWAPCLHAVFGSLKYIYGNITGPDVNIHVSDVTHFERSKLSN